MPIPCPHCGSEIPDAQIYATIELAECKKCKNVIRLSELEDLQAKKEQEFSMDNIVEAPEIRETRHNPVQRDIYQVPVSKEAEAYGRKSTAENTTAEKISAPGTSTITVTTDSQGRQILYAKNPPPRFMPVILAAFAIFFLSFGIPFFMAFSPDGFGAPAAIPFVLIALLLISISRAVKKETHFVIISKDKIIIRKQRPIFSQTQQFPIQAVTEVSIASYVKYQQNGKPVYGYAPTVRTQYNSVRFFSGLSEEEQRWIVSTLKSQLASRGANLA